MRRKKIRKVSILPRSTNNTIKRIKSNNVSKSNIVPKKTKKAQNVINPELYYKKEGFQKR